MADFTGFYFDNIHSSTYGILRVSNNNRYTEGLIPEFSNSSVELTGGNGDLYGGRRFSKTSFSMNIVFDHITEQQFRDLRRWLSGEGLKSFRFDERPYKTYWVTLDKKPELQYICFMEDKKDGVIGEKERIYKGEGTLNFIAYCPFGFCIDNTDVDGKNWQELRTYLTLTNIGDNILEWAETSGLKNSLNGYNAFEEITTQDDIDKGIAHNYAAKIYNPGDFDVDFQLGFVLSEDVTQDIEMKFYIGDDEVEDENGEYFVFSLEGLTADSKIYVNTNNHTISVYSPDELGNLPTSPSLRYDLVKSTHWLQIPQGEKIMKVITAAPLKSLGKVSYNYKYY